MKTPPISIDATQWLSTLSAEDLAFVQGAAFQRLAMLVGMTEADLYVEWAERAVNDPDCQVIREP